MVQRLQKLKPSEPVSALERGKWAVAVAPDEVTALKSADDAETSRSGLRVPALHTSAPRRPRALSSWSRAAMLRILLYIIVRYYERFPPSPPVFKLSDTKRTAVLLVPPGGTTPPRGGDWSPPIPSQLEK